MATTTTTAINTTVNYTELLTKLRTNVSQYMSNNTLSTSAATKKILSNAKNAANGKNTKNTTSDTKNLSQKYQYQNLYNYDSNSNSLSQKYQYQDLYNYDSDDAPELSDDFAWLHETYKLAFGGDGKTSKYCTHSSRFDDLTSDTYDVKGGWRDGSCSYLNGMNLT